MRCLVLNLCHNTVIEYGTARLDYITMRQKQYTPVYILILINGVLQAPGSNGNFTLSEPSGTQLSWTGSGLVTATRDPNAASIPIGGLIVL